MTPSGRLGRSTWRARRGAAALVILLLLALAAIGPLRTALWRASYPYLPRSVQALPYRLAMRLAPAPRTPAALPTPLAIGATTRQTPRGALPAPSSPATSIVEFRADGSVATSPPGSTTTSTPSPLTGAAPSSSAASATETTLSALTPTADATAGTQATPAAAWASTLDLPPRAQLNSPRHEYQTWNNCGPATLGMALGVLGATVGQRELAKRLKPDPDDKNVSPDELVDEAHRQGYGALARAGGSIDGLRALLSSGFPVIVESWFIPEPGDEMGHYLLLVGYDDDAAALIAFDSYHGPNQRLPYVAFDELWRAFNRTYIVFYPPDGQSKARAALGPAADDGPMWSAAADTAAHETETRGDAFAWFNLGSSRLALGDAPSAAAAFDRAREIGLPWRFLWYQFGPFEAYAALERWSDVLALAAANLANAGNLEESLYWRGRALAATGHPDEARRAFERALDLNPNYAAAAEALGRP